VRAGGIALVTLLTLSTAPGRAEQCRQALALGLDVSGSVSAAEYALQRDGLAAALQHPDVAAALLSMPEAPVRIAVFEWSGQSAQALTLPWTAITDRAALEAATARIAATRRRLTSQETAIGMALVTGARLLGQHGACWKRTLDLSGDGKSNSGPRPRDVKGSPALAGITVNGLVIGSDREGVVAELSAYYAAEVIRGPGAFVEVALDFADYETAMVRKLLKELEGLNLAAAPRVAQ